MTKKRFSPSADNNKKLILNILTQYITPKDYILEIGSGTGQHISFFAENFSDNIWQPSDLASNHESIKAWCHNQKNIKQPLLLQVAGKYLDNDLEKQANHFIQDSIISKPNIIYSANTCHIMSWPQVKNMLNLTSLLLSDSGLLILYGPFNIDGNFTSESNKQFDTKLKSENKNMGIRDFADIKSVANEHKLNLIQIHKMPANNMILVLEKT